ncbi:MAG: hypothetical protein PUI48_09240 [Oscillospiraceae bacterium]|nr:hypothetical protein [Oscillospiraceae bacterium]MDY6207409.1 hypothetical protein [Oscillospiraceae bacterium]
MKAFDIIIIIFCVIEAVILAGCIGDIAKALRNGIKLTAHGKGAGYVIICSVLTVVAAFNAHLSFSLASQYKSEIADLREQDQSVLTEEYDEGSVDGEEKLLRIEKSRQSDNLENNVSRLSSQGLFMILCCEAFLNFILCGLIFVTDKGIVYIGGRKKANLSADIKDGVLRINLDSPKGSSTVCKVKDTPKNREILNPYIR